MRDSVRRTAGFRCIALLALALCAYGYGEEQDPFVEAWKLVASRANQGQWDGALAAAGGLDAGLDEIRLAFGWPLRAEIRAALGARDARALVRGLTTSACGAVLWKLEASAREGLVDYYASKYRIEAARTLYAELLAPAVRHRDETRGEPSHERIWDGLARAQAALGRPGFLGRGRVAPDAGEFAAADLEIEAALRAAFPFVPEVKR